MKARKEESQKLKDDGSNLIDSIIESTVIKSTIESTIELTIYPGRRCSRNRLNQKFYGQNLNFDVPEKFFQKPKIYMCTKKNMQKNGQKSPGSTPAPGLTFSL